jgi:hypothetical protein
MLLADNCRNMPPPQVGLCMEMTKAPNQDRGEVAEYVRDIACELAAMTRAAGQSTLSLILEMAVLEATDLRERSGTELEGEEPDQEP